MADPAELPRHSEWAIKWLTTLIREHGGISWVSLQTVLTDDDVRRVGPALLPLLKAWRKDGRHAALLNLAGSLGQRLRRLRRAGEPPRVAGAHDEECEPRRLRRRSDRGHRPDRLAGLVPRLLGDDKSWVTQTAVQQHLHRRRQDLLTPFLGLKPVDGRFSTGRRPLSLPFSDGFHRWSGEQARTYAASLRRLFESADATRRVFQLSAWLRQYAGVLARTASCSPAVASDDERPALRDEALSLLGQRDDGGGVPVLLEALGDDRSRVRLCALRLAFLETPAAHVMGLLRQAPEESHGRQGSRPPGRGDGQRRRVDFLRELDGRKLHRDMHVALLRAVWTHLDRDESWAMIDRAVESGEPALLFAVVRIPADRLSDGAEARLIDLLTRLLDHPEPTVRSTC